ncbi:MAG: metallophosphoesterase family protein [Cyclobacteriaceae bacterium]|nr:metallophosphoesterase family protein [Cyclobacteriaceae bacterium]
MKIGLLSDTHSYLDPKVFEYFKECDEIWHAGDIGDPAVIDALENFKPVRAVYGNIDDKNLQIRFPEDLWFECEGTKIWMTHIGGAPPNYNPRVKKILKEKTPDIFICGHSHILRVKKDDRYNMLYINPGAAGNHGFHRMKTLIRMEITTGKVSRMEVIELGLRGQG